MDPFLSILHRLLRLLFIISVLFSRSAMVAFSAEDDEKEKKDEKSIAEILKDCDSTNGLFRLHQNRENGELFLEVKANQLSGEDQQREFIHFSHTLDGVPELGFFRGQFSRSKIFTIRRHFDKLEFVGENTAFYFSPDSALRRASDANISEAILAAPKIVAKEEDDSRFLVEANNVFLKEFFRQLKSGKKKDDKDDTFKLGDLSKDRTRFIESKTFPDS